ncbi:hypothetical protein R5W23_003848 [Gemmata sp. JC673]|uniref:Uncharacterized protein n=1 Tax=Gemmata algarum TaxID=2975278 RepID=A0ABU5F6M7_9BACT|nr:hypothetical protein [Gemmata algarum]MDY3562382.1 hypothetical protein [Gemmata algarum]
MMEQQTEPLLTVRQAYLVMFEFLRCHYERGPTDDIGGLLGGLSLLTDGSPADSAVQSDFAGAVTSVLAAEAGACYRKADFKLGSRGSA